MVLGPVVLVVVGLGFRKILKKIEDAPPDQVKLVIRNFYCLTLF
jgi:hypothetical protein